ncbi:plasmid pRiA4b ORF-3 family protein [Bacillus sp. RAR_GA_16]|uniref:plasmid pRiA4b ORF-3 family protein n=1 Tax=Bacillus sp. RAR_GA_16 TaxID=2876774 RepID=UPI001CD0130D|nr:plasmid pRiA4b ORF-3 family protein [Bacillus sp. RAR_GA_16]MCA0172171.1 plasmid pRiA4b ORF-3 family protein [Bacillus sp. RAR_GA_16]
MFIQCTKKLLDELKVNVVASNEVEEELLHSWHANMLKFGRKKVVVFTNDKNRYAIVLYGVKAKDFKQLDQLLLQGIERTFAAEGIIQEVIDQVTQNAGETIYSKTKNPTTVARLNKACENVEFGADMIDPDSLIQEELSQWVSSTLYGNGKNSYIYPNKQLYKDLEELSGGPIFSKGAVELKVTLELGNHSIWRRLRVPTNTSFSQFHRILQIAFGWMDSHLHDFMIYSADTDQQLVNLVSSQHAFEFQGETPMLLESEKKLSDYLPARIVYTYDYGDDWVHKIEVEKTIEDAHSNESVCLDGEGSAPPEDVGGEGGFEEFLHIIRDPNHPDYEHMMNWGLSQGYKPFNREMVNYRLRR